MKKCFLTLFIFSGIFLANTASADFCATDFDIHPEFNGTYITTGVDTYNMGDFSLAYYAGSVGILRSDSNYGFVGDGLYYYNNDGFIGAYFPASAITGNGTISAGACVPVLPIVASFSVISTTSALEMIAGVGNAVKDTGYNLWVIVALAISIPLAFYVFEKVTEIIPVENKNRR